MAMRATRLLAALAVIAAVSTALPLAQEDGADVFLDSLDSSAPKKAVKAVKAVASATKSVWSKGGGAAAAAAAAAALGKQAGGHTGKAETAAKKTPIKTSTHAVAQATMDVWGGKGKWNRNFAGDGHGKSWHCRHCHSKCQTNACRKWCHVKFCNPKIKTGATDMGQVIGGGHESSWMRTIRTDANHHLDQVKTATKIYVLNDAARALRKYHRTFKHDIHQYKRKLTVKDDLDKARYRSHAGRQRQRRKLRIIRRYARKDKMKAQRLQLKRAKKRTAKYNAYVKGEKAYAQVSKLLSKGGVWNTAVQKQAHVNTRFMKKGGSHIKTRGITANRVAAEIGSSEVPLSRISGSKLP